MIRGLEPLCWEGRLGELGLLALPARGLTAGKMSYSLATRTRPALLAALCPTMPRFQPHCIAADARARTDSRSQHGSVAPSLYVQQQLSHSSMEITSSHE